MTYTKKTKEEFYKLYKDGKKIEEICYSLQVSMKTAYRWKKIVEIRDIVPAIKRNKILLETKNNNHYNVMSRKQKFDFITELMPVEKIKELLQQHHSFGMIKDLLQRDYLTEDISEVAKLIICDKKHQVFANILKSNNLSFDLEKYNKMPQHWKIQYRFPKNYTEEQIKQEIRNTSSAGQKITVNNMKNNGSYHNRVFDKSWSPFSLDFYLKKGCTEKEAKERIKNICSNGAKACLKKGNCSSIEQKVKELLIDKGINFSHQYYVTNNKTEDTRKNFVYDFLIVDKNIIIEVNGDYFHANPIFYKEEDTLPHPGGSISAKDIWERDKRKIDFIENMGYKTVVLWEYEINHHFDTVKERLVNAGIY